MTNVLTVEHTAPGGWLAAVIPGRLAVVHRTADDDGFAARLWAALSDDDGIRLVIDELAKGGLTNAPGFVLAEWDGSGDTFDGRFIVRGGAGVVVETARGSEDITARGVSTWVERPVTGITGFRIECLPSNPVAGPSLPLAVGTAWVSGLAFGSLAVNYVEVADGIPAAEWTPPVVRTPVVQAPEPIAVIVPPAEADAEPPVAQDDEPGEDEVDLDRTIADLEVTVAGEDAIQPPDTKAQETPHETTGYDHLFGATMMRSVEDAAARPQVEDADEHAPAEPPAAALMQLPVVSPAPGAAGTALGDHDGLTVMSGDLRALRESAGSAIQPAPPAAPRAPAISAEPDFVLQLPSGAAEPIDGMVVVGRAPSVSKMGGGRVPRLVTVDSVEHDISRNHVQLTIEGGTVVVTDLHSRNGTLISLPGKTPQKLRAGEPTSVIAGTIIDLGSGVTLGVVQA